MKSNDWSFDTGPSRGVRLKAHVSGFRSNAAQVVAVVVFAVLCAVPLAALAVLLSGCGYMVDESEAIRAARTMGFSEVRVADRHVVTKGWAGCSKSDAVGFDVSAKNPAGQPASLVVCCGALFNGCAVRSK